MASNQDQASYRVGEAKGHTQVRTSLSTIPTD